MGHVRRRDQGNVAAFRFQNVQRTEICRTVSRYIIALKRCTTMQVVEVIDTLNLALRASGCGQATLMHKPRPLSDNGLIKFWRE